MNQNIQNVLNSIVSAFESGDIPEAVAVASFPIADIPSAQWSFTNRTIQFINGTGDARGYRQWKSVGRQVAKGSKSIYILAPCLKKQKDEETEEEKLVLTSFKAVPVFKIEDTDGEPLDYQNIELPNLPLLNRAQDWGISVKAVPGNYRYYGYFSPERKEIALATSSEKTFFHELSHTADFIIKGNLKPGQDPFQEITAELSAQALARIAGKSIEDTTGNSFRYIKRYAEQIKMNPHKACLKVLSDCEKILNLILHGRADKIKDLQKVA
ncbi:MAG: antirestriction protein [Proteobacteria bacterium]|nr:antirestriction protein [Pseudomonadota bacterium]MBU1389718.1 antirestriction protein [Pseudomonadota bacterium]MBU1542656.1 antirestriction protein [Pseudomonadota bacterium]MBU2480731.1 antirestriction protein [Pseudomonadota bacterium]